ncbi:ASCH domain-containing protein [Massilia sp. SR12]
MTTTPIPANLSDFWSAFANSIGGVDAARFYEVCIFGDSEELANELAELVLRGTKRATAGSVWSCESEGRRLPMQGDLSIVTNWSGSPLCIIETEVVEVVPFSTVTSEFAAIEGEGDGSLSYWREAHRQYFTRECARAGWQFNEDMLVACERFKVVYQPSTNAP